MSYTDLKGLPVSTTCADALSAYERGVDLFLRWRSGAPKPARYLRIGRSFRRVVAK